MIDGLDFIDGLEHDLVAAAARRRDARRAARLVRLRQRLGRRGAGLTLLLLAFVGVATAGATFAALRAAVIRPPAARDVPRERDAGRRQRAHQRAARGRPGRRPPAVDAAAGARLDRPASAPPPASSSTADSA